MNFIYYSYIFTTFLIIKGNRSFLLMESASNLYANGCHNKTYDISS